MPLRAILQHYAVAMTRWCGPTLPHPAGTTSLFNGHEQCRCHRKNAVEGAEDRFFMKGNLSVTFFRWCVASSGCLQQGVAADSIPAPVAVIPSLRATHAVSALAA